MAKRLEFSLDGLNFSKDEALRKQLQDTLRSIYTHLAARDPEITLDGAQRKALTAKLVTHTVNGNPERMKKLEGEWRTIVDALREYPQGLTDHHSIAWIVEQHAADNRLAAERLKQAGAKKAAQLKKANTGKNAPPVMAKTKGYYLVECKTPQHLVYQSRYLEHCVGTNFNNEMLHAKGIAKDSDEALQYLTYYIAMRKGETRIFSLFKDDGMPEVTIEYDVATRSIVQVEGENDNEHGHAVYEEAAYFPALCHTLFQLRKTVPISGIQGLPETSDDKVVTADGLITEEYWNVPLGKILAGTIVCYPLEGADEKGMMEFLESVGNLPGVILSFKEKPNAKVSSKNSEELLLKMPKTLMGAFASNFFVERLTMSGVETIGGHITAGNALHFIAPDIITIGDGFFADSVHIVEAPKLRSIAGAAGFSNARRLVLPQLRQAASIEAPKAYTFELPELRQSSWLKLDAHVVHLPKLHQCAEILIEDARTFTAPKLRQCKAIKADNLPILDLPQLLRAGDIEASSAYSLYLPQLLEAGDIRANGHTGYQDGQSVLRAARLQKAKEINLTIDIVDFSSLEEVDRITLANASMVDLRGLMKITENIVLDGCGIVYMTEEFYKVNKAKIYMRHTDAAIVFTSPPEGLFDIKPTRPDAPPISLQQPKNLL